VRSLSSALVPNRHQRRKPCNSTLYPRNASVASTITQAVGLRVAQGESSLYFTCTGKPQRESGLAAANVNGAPFRLGTAVVRASLTDCPGANCTGASTDKVLSIGQ